MPYAHFTYTVDRQTRRRADRRARGRRQRRLPRLVLSACTPLFSAAKRLLVFARLTRTVPVGAGACRGARPPGAQEALVGDQLEQPACSQAAAPPSLPPVLESLEPHLRPPARLAATRPGAPARDLADPA